MICASFVVLCKMSFTSTFACATIEIEQLIDFIIYRNSDIVNTINRNFDNFLRQVYHLTINEVIRQLLKEQGKKQRELADYVGVRQNTVSDWIVKDKSPLSNYVYRIRDFFDVSYDYLFTGQEKKESSPLELTQGERELFKLVHPLSETDKMKVTGVVEQYLLTKYPRIEVPEPLDLRRLQLDQLFKSTANKPQ